MDEREILNLLKNGSCLQNIQYDKTQVQNILRPLNSVIEITEEIKKDSNKNQVNKSKFESFWVRGEYGSGKTEALLSIKNNLARTDLNLATIFIDVRQNQSLSSEKDFGENLFNNFIVEIDQDLIQIVEKRYQLFDSIQKPIVANGLKLAQRILGKESTQAIPGIGFLGFVINPAITNARKWWQYRVKTVSNKVKRTLSEINQDIAQDNDIINLITYWIRYSIFLDNDTREDFKKALNNANEDSITKSVLYTLQLIGADGILFLIDEADKLLDNKIYLKTLELIKDKRTRYKNLNINIFFIFTCTYPIEEFADKNKTRGFARRFVIDQKHYFQRLPIIKKKDEEMVDDDLLFALNTIKNLKVAADSIDPNTINLSLLDNELRQEIEQIKQQEEELSWHRLWRLVCNRIDQ